MSEAAFVVALIAVSITFLVTVLGAAWKLGARLAALEQELKDQRQQIEQIKLENLRLSNAAEARRTEDVTRWLSFTEKLSTITGLVTAQAQAHR